MSEEELTEMLNTAPIELLWNKTKSLVEENQKYKEIIDKAIKYIEARNNFGDYKGYFGESEDELENLYEILKEVE